MERDVHSFARPEICRVTHLDLDLRADFGAKTLSGTAALDLLRADGARELVLDSDGLRIDAVTDGAGSPLSFAVAPRDPVLGSAVTIALGPDTERVILRYATDPEAAALQWLEPRQTAGSRPFLFTQGQAILTRTWIPCQDTPGVRQSYGARITVPKDLVAVMSAHCENRAGEEVAGGRRFTFDLPYAIPSYLIALGIGDLAFRPLGERCGVWAERPVAPLAAAEFVDTEQMIEAAEHLYGPYRWGRYDILVLPPSFPFGGMENPCMTFATPTVLAGDRSLVSLVAHELAHSWSGNLVTNATWSDLWLNEGFTVYFERRIMEELKGRAYVDMLRVLGWQDLQEDLKQLEQGPDTRLHVDVSGRNPDDAFSNVPYEKGALFLEQIEKDVGRPRFDAFLRDYFDRFAFQPMTADRFRAWLQEALYGGDAARLERLRVREWIHGQGLPAGIDAPTSTEFDRVLAARDAFESGAPAASLDVRSWTTHHWLHFLRNLRPGVARSRLDDLDRTFSLTGSRNNEILFEWLRIAVREHDEAAFGALEEFLVRQGRRKFLKPLYQDLLKSDWGRPLARRIFERARPGYHAVSENTIADLLAKAGA